MYKTIVILCLGLSAVHAAKFATGMVSQDCLECICQVSVSDHRSTVSVIFYELCLSASSVFLALSHSLFMYVR